MVLAEGGVAGGKLPQENTETPAVEDNVMDIESEQMVPLADPPQPEAIERAFPQIEKMVGFPLENLLEIAFRDAFHRQGEVIKVDDVLESLAAGGLTEEGAQTAVTADESLQGLFQGGGVQVAAETEGGGNVIGG